MQGAFGACGTAMMRGSGVEEGTGVGICDSYGRSGLWGMASCTIAGGCKGCAAGYCCIKACFGKDVPCGITVGDGAAFLAALLPIAVWVWLFTPWPVLYAER